MNYVSIRFDSDWNPEYNHDDDNEEVIPRSEAGPMGSSRVAEKYMIGGPLCDPIVTGNVETAAETVRNQLARVKVGADLNHVFEVITAHRKHILTNDEYQSTLPEIEDLPGDLFDDDAATASPLQSVAGVGDTTIKRFASRFGVYPNLRTAEWDDYRELLPGWNNHPDLDQMDLIIAAITEHYQDLSTQGNWPGPIIDIDQFDGYPIGNPTSRIDI